jgi:hypothetical protein
LKLLRCRTDKEKKRIQYSPRTSRITTGSRHQHTTDLTESRRKTDGIEPTGLQTENEHKTFANAQFFAINGNFLTKERRLFCTQNKLRVALPTLRLSNSIDRLAGAKTHQKVESQTIRVDVAPDPEKPSQLYLRHPPLPLFHNREETKQAKPQNKAAGEASQEESNSGAQNPKRSDFYRGKGKLSPRKQATSHRKP